MVISVGFTNSRRMRVEQGREGKVHPVNADFQKIARRDKKAFFNEQCLIIEENNKKGKD